MATHTAQLVLKDVYLFQRGYFRVHNFSRCTAGRCAWRVQKICSPPNRLRRHSEKVFPSSLLIIYFIFKHILLAQNRPESDADGSEVTESLSVIPFQVLSNWKIPDSSSLPFSDNSKLLHPDSNQENTREYVPAKHDHLLLQAKTF